MIIQRQKLYSSAKASSIDKNEEVAGKALAVGGAGTILTVDRDKLTGIEHRYHSTETKNVDSIKKNGIRSSYSTDPNNLTNTVLGDVDMSRKKGKVYVAKSRLTAYDVGFSRFLNKGVKSKTLKVNIPYEDHQKLKFAENPELRGMNKKDWVNDRLKFLKNSPKGDLYIKMNGGERLTKYSLGKTYEELSKGSEVIEGNIDSKYIKGGKGYKKQGLRDLYNYAKKHKSRFGKQAIKGVLGLSMLAGGAHLINKSSKSRLNKTAKK